MRRKLRTAPAVSLACALGALGALTVTACSSDSDTGGGSGGSSATGGSGAGGTTGGRASGGSGGSGGTGGSSASGGSSGSGGSTAGSGGATGGAGGSAGSGGSGGSGGSSGGASGAGGRAGDAAADSATGTDMRGGSETGATPTPGGRFSFFVTSMDAMLTLAGNKVGFGGDLRFGMPTGLEGADKICQSIAAKVGAGDKTWRAFLSATKGGPSGGPVHAIERIGQGPWYDRSGRVVAMNPQSLTTLVSVGTNAKRPTGDPQATGVFLDENGQAARQGTVDNHDTLTGSNDRGMLNSMDPGSTCQDWASSVGPGSGGKVNCGHSWGWGGWIRAHTVPGCAPGINLVQNGAGSGNCVGCGGGYGGIYCFALSP